MWLLFGLSAMVTALWGLVRMGTGKETKGCSFASLSLTALTLCAFYSADAQWVAHQDWSALMDVTPTLSGALWVLTLVSILLNGISLFGKRR